MDQTISASLKNPKDAETQKKSQKIVQTPKIIGKYRVQALVAKGGMGAVYKSIHPSLRRTVILKKLTIRGSKIVRERFKREAQILLDLQSPYIVHVYDYFVEGQSHYIVEEFVDGVALDKLIEKEMSLGTELSLWIFLHAAYALKYAHSKGIVHRDVKPANILISKNGEIKLADFGIASSEKDNFPDFVADSSQSSQTSILTDQTLTRIGTTLGTPAYMSPEQIEDSSSVDKRSDIYSLGVMLYEMITGSRPFPSNLSQKTLEKMRKEKYPSPRALDKSIPKKIERLIKKMLRANPKKRFQSVNPIIKITKKYLSQFEAGKIHAFLRKIVSENEPIKIPVFARKIQTAKKVASASIFSILALCAIFFLWREGFFYKTILRAWFKPLEIELSLPLTASVDADLPVRAFFFIDDGEKIPEVFASRRIFFENRKNLGEKSSQVKSYSVKPVYLLPGRYRLKIAAGPYIIWQSIEMQKSAKKLIFSDLKNARREISLHLNAFDEKTGADITSKTEFFVLIAEKWVKIEKVDSKTLRTGRVWKILAKNSLYKDEIFSLIIDWYQDDVRVNAILRKK